MNPFYLLGQDLIDKGYITDPYNADQWKTTTDASYYSPTRFWESFNKIKTLQKGESDAEQALEILKNSYFHNPVAGQVRKPRTTDREWRLQNHDLYAIPKERVLYLKIQE